VGGVTTWHSYRGQNKLLGTNQAGNVSPTFNQAQPYRLYTCNASGEPLDIHHRDAAAHGVIQDQYAWDGMQKLRRLFCVGASEEHYRVDDDGAGMRVSSRLDGVDHEYTRGPAPARLILRGGLPRNAGLLQDTAGDTLSNAGPQPAPGSRRPVLPFRLDRKHPLPDPGDGRCGPNRLPQHRLREDKRPERTGRHHPEVRWRLPVPE
jgi:hypothetical protein